MYYRRDSEAFNETKMTRLRNTNMIHEQGKEFAKLCLFHRIKLEQLFNINPRDFQN